MLKGENPEEDQFSPLVLQRIWFHSCTNVCVLLDVGTMPGPGSIYHLWKSFDLNSNVGGPCGEIVPLKGNLVLDNALAAEDFEYKMSNILDKPLYVSCQTC
jgi:cellulose synthase/poly-beta-1,6-N-acetylglucosamine synthase-like glycosyltransferase